MSLSHNPKLILIAKDVCRKLRKKSTPSEILFWEKVRDRKFEGKKFLRQHPIFYDCNGRETFFVADYYCFEVKLVVELDGPIHDYKIESDKSRTKFLELNGYRVVRFKNDEIERDINNVLLKLSTLLV